VKLWSHSDILINEKGYIYATEDVYPKNYLKRYNVASKTWEKFPQKNIDPIRYDISGNIFACVVSPDGVKQDTMVSIYKIPEYILLNKFPEHYSFTLNKSGTRITMLKRLKGIEYPEGIGTAMDGALCLMSIYNIDRQDTTSFSSVLTLDYGIDWSPDGNKLVFVTLPDSINIRGINNPGELVLSVNPEGIKQIVIYDIFQHKSVIIGNGIYPRWTHDGSRIYFIRKDYLYEYNTISGVEKRLFKMPETTNYYLSPTDENLVLTVRSKVPLSYTCQITIINIKTDKRYILDGRAVYECGWSY